MRKDMAKVIVTRPRLLDSAVRKGRTIPDELQPKAVGLHRHAQEQGGYKMLNETLAPLRRYLEAQIGRPWNAVYSEIAANLRPTSTVQQHVRDHLKDFVNLHRQPHAYRRYQGRPWFEPLYVDTNGILRRTEDLPEVRAARRRQRAGPSDPTATPIRLSAFRKLSRIAGVWYEVGFAPLPEPEYRLVIREVKQRIRPYDASSPERTIKVRVRQLITPAVQDAISGRMISAGPESDDHVSWRRYRETQPERVYAITKRQLSRRELRRYNLHNTIT